MRRLLLVAAAAALASGCSLFQGNRIEDAAAYHLRLADSLEHRKEYREAIRHYESVTGQYARSASYPAAVRRLALVYAGEFNNAHADSVALYWFGVYVRMPLKKFEQENVHAFVSLLRRSQVLRDDLARRAAAVDSLSLTSRRQAGAIGADARRLQEVTEELLQTQKELAKMRDIDLRISKNRGRK
jgi:hypothetical protein